MLILPLNDRYNFNGGQISKYIECWYKTWTLQIIGYLTLGILKNVVSVLSPSISINNMLGRACERGMMGCYLYRTIDNISKVRVFLEKKVGNRICPTAIGVISG